MVELQQPSWTTRIRTDPLSRSEQNLAERLVPCWCNLDSFPGLIGVNDTPIFKTFVVGEVGSRGRSPCYSQVNLILTDIFCSLLPILCWISALGWKESGAVIRTAHKSEGLAFLTVATCRHDSLHRRGVRPAACWLHVSQDGYECSPTQNHKFT